MWHVSISQQRHRRGLRPENLHVPRRLESTAVDLLRGVGGDREWWYWSPHRIGHLRVALTADEVEQVPPWCGPIDDAGAEGVERRRTP